MLGNNVQASQTLELAVEHILTKSILKLLNRLLLVNKHLVQTIGGTRLKFCMDKGMNIKIKYKYMNHMNTEKIKIIVKVDK